MVQINKRLYKSLIAQGLSPTQIDDGDFFYLIDVYFESDTPQEQEKIVYADQVPWL